MGRFADAADSIDSEPRCSFGEYLYGLEDDERTELLTLLETRSFQYIMRLVRKVDGRSFSKDTVSNHAHGDCRCRA
jgi:hypothetical protein